MMRFVVLGALATASAEVVVYQANADASNASMNQMLNMDSIAFAVKDKTEAPAQPGSPLPWVFACGGSFVGGPAEVKALFDSDELKNLATCEFGIAGPPTDISYGYPTYMAYAPQTSAVATPTYMGYATQQQDAAILNFGSAIVQAGMSVDYGQIENEAVTSSLMLVLDADKNTSPNVVAQIDESFLLQTLDRWYIPVPAPLRGAPTSRFATAVERAQAIMAWRMCRFVSGKDMPVVTQSPDQALIAQLAQQQFDQPVFYQPAQQHVEYLHSAFVPPPARQHVEYLHSGRAWVSSRTAGTSSRNTRHSSRGGNAKPLR